jgi:pimeloyl-ACP methyl ester carboxylesterase
MGEERVAYDEFGLFHENAAEYGLPFESVPEVRRVEVPVAPGRCVSALVWGDTPPEIVLLHGGAQNAHTWDTVALALGRPLVAIDLPGHGHSGWRDDGLYTPPNLADDVAVAIAALAPDASLLVGMSLGGMTAMCVASRHSHLVRSLVMVDVTPGVNAQKAKAVIDFVNGPQSFQRFDDLLARTIEHNPTRTESSLRRGILHNAHQLDDGSWEWRYDRRGHARTRPADEEAAPAGTSPVGTSPAETAGGEGATPDVSTDPRLALSPLWDDVSAVACPLLLVRGSLSPVVDDDDVAELLRRQPTAEVVVVDGAGHSVQGDRPLELAALLTTRL